MANTFAKNILKVFRSYDFRGNKILNAKVNTPINNEDIPNKLFVDTAVKYDTDTVLTKDNSTTFNWMTGLKNLTVKQVLDKLLFNSSLPVFINPVLNTFYFLPENLQLSNGKYIAFYDNSFKGKLEYSLIDNDRLPQTNTKLVVTFVDNSTMEFYDSDNSGIIPYDIIYGENCKFELHRTYDAALPKEDDYIAPGFELPYDLIIDVTKLIDNQIIQYPSPLISTLMVEESIPTYDETTIEAVFEKKLHFGFNQTDEVIIHFLIPEEIINKSSIYKHVIYFAIIDESNDVVSFVRLPKYLINKFNDGIDSLEYNGIIYMKYQYNFGLIGINGKLMMDFTL